ncbi:efflux RND transporter permease subunit [Patescibacteria group bacterium]|nr:efflux RND transporter permease subunit [Patescibacteria group bacterium]
MDPIILGPPKKESEENNQYKHHRKNPLYEQKIAKCSKGFCGFFVLRKRITLLAIIAIVLVGSIAVFNIPREADPEVKIPIAVVSTFYAGASPADVENLITDKIESKVEELDDLKLVTSSSVLGMSSVVVEFEAEADLDDSIRNLRDKIAEVKNLPGEAEDPFVTEVRIDDTAIISFSLASQLDAVEIKKIGEDIQEQLEKIPGVSDVPLLGVQDREFSVVVSRGQLERLNIGLGTIINAIAIANTDAPLGSITIDATDYNIRTVAKIDSLAELKKIVITNIEGRTILLEDVAEIKDDLAEKRIISRLSVDGKPVQNTISLQVYKRTGGNIIEIVDTAKEKIQKLKDDGTIPAEVTVEESFDYSQFIRDDLRVLGRSGIQAVIFIFLILFLALSIREAAISLIAIPMTFLITLTIMYHAGYTVNSLALFALVLSLGLLVDAFIIILEGIFHNMRIGFNSREAALLSVAHYRKPLISGTLTTISAFVPMLLVSGIMGEFLKVLPITIAITLLSSLFVSLALVPAIASLILKRRPAGDAAYKESYLEKILTKRLTAWYVEKVEVFLKNRKPKRVFLTVITLLFVGSLGLLIGGVIPVELFPEVDVDFSLIDIEMPIGTDLEASDEIVGQVESILYEIPEVKSFVTTIGRSSGFGFSGSSSRDHLSSINVTYKDEKFRDRKSYEVDNEIRDKLKAITKGKITVREISAGPPTGAPIEVRILGDELQTLDELAVKLINVLENTEGVIEVESDREISPADLTFKLNREALAKSGLSVVEVASFLRTAIFGITATEVTVDGEDIDVIVKFDENLIDSVEQIKNLTITNNFGQSYKLSRLADFSLEPALATIRHRDFVRTASVRANLEEGYAPTEIMPIVQEQIEKETIPAGYEFNFGGEVEDIEQSFTELWNALIVAVILIILILVLQFDSFKKPFIIVLTLPLMVIGVVFGMLIFRLPFSFSVFLGLISLAGIVVNDAIVLIDKADRNVKEKKMKPRQAIANAGATRLQPILLTSITTIAGVLPLAFADEFWFGLSISIIFGLAFATVLQLFVIPMIYLKLEGNGILKRMNFEE